MIGVIHLSLRIRADWLNEFPPHGPLVVEGPHLGEVRQGGHHAGDMADLTVGRRERKLTHISHPGDTPDGMRTRRALAAAAALVAVLVMAGYPAPVAAAVGSRIRATTFDSSGAGTSG